MGYPASLVVLSAEEETLAGEFDPRAVSKTRAVSQTRPAPKIRAKTQRANLKLSRGQARRAPGKEKKALRTSTKLTLAQKQQLVIDNQEHGKRLAWSFLSTWRIRLNPDEILSVVGASLCEAAHRFDPDRGCDFKTFFFYHLRGMLLKEISRVIEEQRVLQFVPPAVLAGGGGGETAASSNAQSWMHPIVDTNNPERMLERHEVASRCWSACAELDPLEQEVMIRFFVYDEPLVQIAKELNYCRCHISRVKTRALGRLAQLLQDEPDSINGSSLGVTEVSEGKNTGSSSTAEVQILPKFYTGGRGRRTIDETQKKALVVSRFLRKAA